MAAQLPTLTLQQAKQLTDEAIAVFEIPANKERLTAAVAQCIDDPGKKMTVVLPLVQEIAGPVLEKYGFMRQAVMQAVLAIKAHSASDADLSAKCTMLQQKLMGQI